MVKLVAISGSLRKESFNTALLRAASTLVPAGATLEVRTLHGIPLYDGDEEAAHGSPPVVLALKEEIAAADGLILATPEYNHSIPGVFKNAIDWLSRPGKDVARVFGGKPVALLGASPGGFGTVRAQNAWLPVLRALSTQPWNGAELLVSRASRAFDESGDLVEEPTRVALAKYLAGFVAFVETTRR
jgi:NAD(P)H-dependent FMN reductase